MQLTVRYIQSKGATRESSEAVFNGDRATIGRGSDQTIQIQDRRVPLAHSIFTLGEGKFELKAEKGQNFTHNSQSSRQKTLKPGDVVEILGHQIRVLPSDKVRGLLSKSKLRFQMWTL